MIAGALAVVLPLWVAHGRVAGHESLVLFWWCGSMLALACWVRSRGDGPDASGDPLAAFACVFAAVAGIFSRPTAVWIVPVLLGAWLVFTRGSLAAAPARDPARRRRAVGSPPSRSRSPRGRSSGRARRTPSRASTRTGRARSATSRSTWGSSVSPPGTTSSFAFVAETPALLLLAAVAGIALALRPGPARAWGVVCLLWLVLPFGQSVSTLRIGAGRYVIQAWPALLLFAAIALDRIGESVASLASRLPKAWSRARPRVARPRRVRVHHARALAGRAVPARLLQRARRRSGGHRRAQDVRGPLVGRREPRRRPDAQPDRSAAAPASICRSGRSHALERLRDDLVPVDGRDVADYVLVSHIQYFAKPPVDPLHEDRPRSTSPARRSSTRTTARRPASPAQVGFAAMTRGAPDDAIPPFREALQRDPLDRRRSSGWAGRRTRREPARGRVPLRSGRVARRAARTTPRPSTSRGSTSEGSTPSRVGSTDARIRLRARAPPPAERSPSVAGAR